MKASLIYDFEYTVNLPDNRKLTVSMDLYRIDAIEAPLDYPEGYKFSWIAFNPDNNLERVLVDCHKGKGPHFHIDEEGQGISFEWTSLDDAMELFAKKVKDRFGVDIMPSLFGDEE